MTSLFLLELATLQNLHDLMNLVSAFSYEKNQGFPELTPFLPLVYDAPYSYSSDIEPHVPMPILFEPNRR